MAILRNMKTLSFSGKLGDIVGCSGSKRSYIRSLPKKKQQEFSALQLASQKKMAMATSILSPLRQLLEQSITRLDKRCSSGYGTAISQLLQHGFKGEFPNLEINYAQLMISTGSLSRTRASLLLENDQQVYITWDNDLPANDPGHSDLAALLIYSESKNEFSLKKGKTLRSEGQLNVWLPDNFRNQRLHYYLFFHTKDFKKASATHYLGFTSTNQH